MNRFVLPLAAVFTFANLTLPMSLPSPYGEAGFGMSVADAAENDPEGIVRSIYAQWAAPCCNYYNVIDTHFTPELRKLYRAVEEGAGDELDYAIDFDIFLDAQDEDTVTDVVTHAVDKGDGRVVVAVTYTAFGESHDASYTFVKTGKGWKIDDMGWGPDRDGLRAMLQDLLAQQAAAR